MTAHANSPFILPPVPNPQAYVGLYVYDFKTHVSVGFTALEIRYLRDSEAYRSGAAYEIYRATAEGGFELRGTLDERLTAREAMCFLRTEADAAREDCDQLRQAADECPLPCATDLRLAMVEAFDPPHLSALDYPAAASHALAGWLNKCGFAGGDRVVGGIDVYAELAASNAVPIESCALPTLIDYRDRTADEVLTAVYEPLQR